MIMSGRNRYPFTATQWEELEHQALIFKYMVSGIPIPPDLIFTIKRSFLEEYSFSSRLFSYQPQHVGWSCFKGRKMDPEPGRCRRTDGKKWRCSKQAYSDSKYCERHMHRGKNRSRKPMEPRATTMANTSTATQSLSLSLSSSDNQNDRHGIGYTGYQSQLNDPFMYPHSSRAVGTGLTLQAHTTEPCRSFSGSSMEDSWQFTPLTTSSSSSNHRPIHHFFDELPPKHRDSSWFDLFDKSSNSSSSPSTTRLSISIFNPRSDNGG
ncbi:Growth-regulating factor 5 [Hibiscus syriacus]|uniref:Growth-regulating factor n=1 Tax=Hibiscus syriacus TaxID=106335 RepID=A0A6A3B5V2_HIBSY|nr:growth-regulating factor 5-like isoform X1 [Hibiscus syriacus]XP_038993813.1 growth-regulating factor 5-like isoform X2 [Hibiscus syriacus]KAE8710439.1 Growth-regulating factor 5 [Hibiscus syriacus]